MRTVSRSVGAPHHRRPKILVHDRYHGPVDESFAELDHSGDGIDHRGTRPPSRSATTTGGGDRRLEGLERELSHGDVAVCMFEPA